MRKRFARMHFPRNRRHHFVGDRSCCKTMPCAHLLAIFLSGIPRIVGDSDRRSYPDRTTLTVPLRVCSATIRVRAALILIVAAHASSEHGRTLSGRRRLLERNRASCKEINVAELS